MARPSLYEMFRLRPLAAAWLVGLAGCATGAGGGRSTDECSEACAKIGAADCGDVGSGCVDACVRTTPAAECNSELGRYADCFWSAEAYECDAERGTTAPACDEQLSAYERCESGVGGEGGGGAAGEASGGAAGESEMTSGAGGA